MPMNACIHTQVDVQTYQGRVHTNLWNVCVMCVWVWTGAAESQRLQNGIVSNVNETNCRKRQLDQWAILSLTLARAHF